MTGHSGRTAPSATATATATEQSRRELRLPATRDRFADIATSARREQQDYLGFLAELVITEWDGRDRRRAEKRVRAAGFPFRKRLDDFSFEANPAVDATLVGRLTGWDWVKAGSPLCLYGGSGTGKSHLLIGLGTRAAEAGYRVRYAEAGRLVADLAEASEASDDDRLAGVMSHYGDVDLLLIDDLSRLHLDRRRAELLLAVLTEREQRCAVASAADAPFSSLRKTFTDPRLCAAIVDRLTFGGHVIDTGDRAYRR